MRLTRCLLRYRGGMERTQHQKMILQDDYDNNIVFLEIYRRPLISEIDRAVLSLNLSDLKKINSLLIFSLVAYEAKRVRRCGLEEKVPPLSLADVCEEQR